MTFRLVHSRALLNCHLHHHQRRWLVLTGTGTTMKSLKGTIWEEAEKRPTTTRRSESFLLFPPSPFKGPRTRYILQLKLAMCRHILVPTFEFAFPVWILKPPFYHSNFLRQSLCIGCDCAYKNCWLCGWQTELCFMMLSNDVIRLDTLDDFKSVQFLYLLW